MENQVTLGYWRIRGLAERIRMILEYIGLPYNEEKFSGEDRKKWFDETKPELQKKNPATTLPYLKDGDKVISESDAIIVYVIHKSGKLQLLGRNGDEQVAVATVAGVMRDLHRQYVMLVYGMYGDKPFEEAKLEYIEKFKPFLNKLDKLLGDKQFYAGQITWIDFAVAQFMQTLRIFDSPLIEGYVHINNHINRIWELPAIKSYVQSDRFSQRPCNNSPPAKWA